MDAGAQARYGGVTPRKARRVVDLIRGLAAGQAQAVLAFAPQAASDPVGKVLASAIANAETTGRVDPESLVVSRAWVDEGPTLKRFRPRAQGRAYRINKRTSHITVIIAEQEETAAAPAGRRRGARPEPTPSPVPRPRLPRRRRAGAAAEAPVAEDAVAEDAVAEDAVAEDAVAEDAVAEEAVAADG